MDDILIDRLVFDLPGLTTQHAGELSQLVGKGLAEKKLKTEGSIGSLTVDLNDQAASSRNLPRLAEEIVDSIVRQIG